MTVDVDAAIHFGLKRNNNKKREIRAFSSPYLTFFNHMKTKRIIEKNLYYFKLKLKCLVIPCGNLLRPHMSVT